MDAFKNTEEDLVANRKGQLSPRQHKRIRRGLLREKVSGIILIVIVGGGVGLAIFTVRNVSFGLLLIAVFAVIVLIIYQIGRANQVRKDLEDGVVNQIYGYARKRKVSNFFALEGNRSPEYYITIGDVKFSVNRKRFNAIQEDLFYVAYYTPTAKCLVAIERSEPE